MSIRKLTLYVEVSDDGRTVFAEVADILDHFALLYEAKDANAYAFLATRAVDARAIDRVYEGKSPPWEGS